MEKDKRSCYWEEGKSKSKAKRSRVGGPRDHLFTCVEEASNEESISTYLAEEGVAAHREVPFVTFV